MTAPRTLGTVQPTACHSGGVGWYCVVTGVRAERRSCEGIAELGLRYFAPTYEATVSHAGRKKRVIKYLLSRYVFAAFDINSDADKWPNIRRVDGVEDIISARGDWYRMPIRIPDHQMAKIINWKENPDIIAAAKVGDIMRVIAGPFCGHEATITAVWGDKYRARGEVKLFGRPTPCEFELDQLERA